MTDEDDRCLTNYLVGHGVIVPQSLAHRLRFRSL
jgi:hypothetical protein